MARTVYQQPSPEHAHHLQHARVVGMLDASSRPPKCWPPWARISSPSPPSPCPTRGRSGRTTHRSASPRRYGDAPTWWASSRTGLRSGGSSAQSLQSSTTRDRSTAALCPLLPSTPAISTVWSHQCFCPQGQPDQSARVTLFHHLTEHDQQSSRHANLLLEGLVWWSSWTFFIYT